MVPHIDLYGPFEFIPNQAGFFWSTAKAVEVRLCAPLPENRFPSVIWEDFMVLLMTISKLL